MRVLAISHQLDAGPGVFAEAARAYGASIDDWLLPTAPSSPPHPADSYDAVMVFGGAMHVDQVESHPWLAGEKELLSELLAKEVPILGMCLGAQLLAEAAGARSRRARRPEIGWHEVEVTSEGEADPLLGPLGPRFEAFQWHSYEFLLPGGATPLARSDVCLQAYRIRADAWGIQFHAEVARGDAEAWIDDYRSDQDAVRIGLDATALRRRTATAIGPWNELGRDLCRRFLDVVATRA
jgi:GMP synthase (glutamine-hydrolysing)